MVKKARKEKNGGDDELIKEMSCWVEASINDLIKYILYDRVKITFSFVKENIKSGKGKVVMSINYDKQYGEAKLYIYPVAVEMFKNQRIEDLTFYLIHELSHIYTTGIMRMAEDRFVSVDQIENEGESITDIFAHYIKTMYDKKITPIKFSVKRHLPPFTEEENKLIK